MTTPRALPDERHPRPFTEFLISQGNGRLAQELTDALDECVQAVSATGKAATLTVQVSLKPLEKGDGRVLTITDKVAVKLPAAERKASLFYVDHDLNLSRNDPDQLTFETIREVPAPPAAENLRTVGGDQ